MATALTLDAAQVRAVDVTERDGEYRLHLSARLDVPWQAAFAALIDYPHLDRLNPAVRAVNVLGTEPGGGTRVRTRIELCALLFCRTLEQVQVMLVIEPGVLRARIVPGAGDFRSGTAEWRLTPCGEAACLRFDARLEPAFWVPPLVGPWLIRNMLAEQAEVTAHGLERAARSRGEHAGG